MTSPWGRSHWATDTFMLDGVEMVKNCTVLGGDHCTRIQNYKQIDQVGSNWVVREKDGTTATYTPLLTNSGGTFRWAIKTVADTRGNTVTYSYSSCNASTDCYPTSIAYNGTTITIGNEPRNDVITFSDGKGLRTSARRLDFIDIFVGGSRARRYVMVWGTSANGGRSLLERVEHRGTDNSTKFPDVVFDYDDGAAGTFANPVTASGIPSFVTNGSQLLTGDFNGDGLTDAFYVPPSGFTYQTWVSQGNGQYVDNRFTKSGYPVPNGRWLSGDVNGDGMSDLAHAATDGKLHVWYSDGDGTFTENVVSTSGATPPPAHQESWVTGDFNGDGKMDFAQAATNGTLYIWQSDGDFSMQVSTVTPGIGSLDLGHWLPADLNGDGNTDLVHVHTTANILYSYVSNGDFTFNRYEMSNPGFPAFQGGKWRVGDFNGDGKTDLFHIGAADNQLSIYYSKGAPTSNGFVAQSIPKPGSYPPTQGGWWFTINVNGDGRTDLYHVASDGTIRLWLSDDAPNDFTHKTINRPSGYPTFINGRIQPGDIDGDGEDDLIHVASDNTLRSWRATGVADNRMTSVKNRLGGTNTITYVPSTTWNNGFLPVGMVNHTVRTVTRNDGRGNSHVLTYEYQDGNWNSAERCFLGFGRLKKILDDPQGNYEETIALQSNNCTTKPQFIYQRNSSNQIYSYVQLEYNDQASSPPFFTLETGRWSFECNLDASCFRTRTTAAYDAYANVTQTVEYGDVDSAGDERTTVREFFPNEDTYVVDRTARERIFAGTSATGTPVAETRFHYDNHGIWNTPPTRGELTRVRVWDDRNAVFYDTQRGYDGFGNVTSETDARGFVTTTIYDSTYNIFPMEICPPLIPCATQTWNAVLGVPDTVIDANGAITVHDYDVLGRRTHTTHPDTTITEFQYFDIGNPSLQRVRVIEPDHTGGLWRDRSFDGFGREWRMQREGGETQLTDYHEVSDRVDRRSITFKSPEVPRYQRFRYDGAKRVDRIDEASNAFTLISYGDGFVTNTDPLAKQKVTYRDGLSRVVQTREKNGSANYDTFYDYDALDNLIQVTDASSNIATFDYDSLERKVGACDFDMGCWTYTFDEEGNLLTQTDAKGQTTIYTYDALGRVETKLNADGELAEWFYDEVGHGASFGRLTRLVYPSGSESFTYDNMGLETQITRCVEADCRTIGQTYEAARLKTLTYPDGETITIGYNAEGYLTSVSGYVTSTTRNARGQIASLVYANGVTTTIEYDNPYDLMSDVTVTGPGGAIYQASYGYNDASQIVTITSTTHVQMNVTYTYDDLYRLMTVTPTGPGTQNQTFDYDPIGNMTLNSDLGAYLYNELSKPHAATQAGPLHFEYDGNGNLASVTTRQSDCVTIERLMAWDGENRLAWVSAEGKTTRYAYSAEGERIRKAGPDGTTKYYGKLLEVEKSDGTPKLVKYYYAGSVLVAKNDGASTYWYHRDHVDSTRVLSNSAGAAAATYEYEAFGETISVTGSVDNDRGFGAHRQDAESGLTFMGARYYDAALGRFTQPDSVVPQPDDPQSWNRYSYARNNPVNRVDPTGHADWFNWDTALDVAQLGIGVAGLVPVVGNVADAANAAISVARGDVAGAAIDAASMVPAAGQAAGAAAISARIARLTAKLGNKGADIGRATVRGLDEGADGVNGARKAVGNASEAAEEAAQRAGGGATTREARGGGGVLLDSSVVPPLRRDPTLGGRLKPGEVPIVSFVTRPELRNAVSTGGNLRGVPGILDDLPVLNTRPSINTRINVRGQLPAGRGRFGDGIIGGQAIEGRIPLITDDPALAGAVRALGGVAR